MEKASDSLTKPNCGVVHKHDLLGEARQMDGADRGGRQRLEREIAVGDAVERIGRRPVEAERLRGGVAVDRKRGAGQRRGAERAFVQPRARIRRSGRDRAPNIST